MARRRQLPFADGTTATPTLAADGSSPDVDWQGGNGVIFAIGTFGGGTLTTNIKAPDDTTYVSLGTGTVFTANGVGGFTAPAGKLRVTLAGSTAPSLKAWCVGIPVNNGG